jgi:hypothetical protein
MDRRQNPRIEVQLPVEVWGLDAFGQAFSSPATITNMSAGGLVLHGLRQRIRAGELLDIRMGQEQAQFRVVWIGDRGSSELGMQRVTDKPFLPELVFAYCSQSALC